MEQLKLAAGIFMVHVPYRGVGPAYTDLLAGQTQAMFPTLFAALPYINTNRVRGLAVTGAKRSTAAPNIPTFKELGLNWVDGAYRGVAMPKATPKALQQKMSDYFALLNADADNKKRLEEAGFVLVDIPINKIPAFMKEKTPGALEDARNAGLLK
jgi:tripartite-type tricarboxylate transporter receptor subunit TctC